VLTEEDLVETALLRYAQQRATKWGADRFRAEFHRRDLEERWLVAARTGATPYSPTTDATAVPEGGMSGPVDAGAQENAVGFDRIEARMVRPAYARHSSVPRPPAEDAASAGKRSRRRKPKPSKNDPAWLITPAEAARMSAASRRLYGLDDPSDPGR
jgi:hypothetical protein